MKITVQENSSQQEIEVLVKCKIRNSQVEQIVSAVNALNFSLAVFQDEKRTMLFADEIFYIESVDERTFVYSEKEVFECPMKLYEIEERAKKSTFARISKSVIVNIKKISFIEPQFNGRFEAQLSNGLKQIVNRHYVSSLKQKFLEVF